MARRRYISTDISTDTRVNKLARDFGDFAALLYTWMIPHAADDATLPGDPEELLFLILPGRRDKTPDDVEAALLGMESLGLIAWDREAGAISFPREAFYRCQTYISAERRQTPPAQEPPRRTAQNAAEQRKPAQNAASVKFRLSVLDSPSPTQRESAAAAAISPAREEAAAADAAAASLPAASGRETPIALLLSRGWTRKQAWQVRGLLAAGWEPERLAAIREAIAERDGPEVVANIGDWGKYLERIFQDPRFESLIAPHANSPPFSVSDPHPLKLSAEELAAEEARKAQRQAARLAEADAAIERARQVRAQNNGELEARGP